MLNMENIYIFLLWLSNRLLWHEALSQFHTCTNSTDVFPVINNFAFSRWRFKSVMSSLHILQRIMPSTKVQRVLYSDHNNNMFYSTVCMLSAQKAHTSELEKKRNLVCLLHQP